MLNPRLEKPQQITIFSSPTCGNFRSRGEENMVFHKKDLDLFLVPSGLAIMFAYHLFFFYRYRHAPDKTVMGIEDADKIHWVEGISEVV